MPPSKSEPTDSEAKTNRLTFAPTFLSCERTIAVLGCASDWLMESAVARIVLLTELASPVKSAAFTASLTLLATELPRSFIARPKPWPALG